jgi:hypothetical protein
MRRRWCPASVKKISLQRQPDAADRAAAFISLRSSKRIAVVVLSAGRVHRPYRHHALCHHWQMHFTEDDMTIAIRKPALGPAAATFIAKDLKMFIDGKWVSAKSGKTFTVEDPTTEETIARVPAGDKADIRLAVGASRLRIRSLVPPLAGTAVSVRLAPGRSSGAACRRACPARGLCLSGCGMAAVADGQNLSPTISSLLAQSALARSGSRA